MIGFEIVMTLDDSQSCTIAETQRKKRTRRIKKKFEKKSERSFAYEKRFGI